VVGGALEALQGEKNVIRLVLNRRKGFIKLALRFGVDLVPTFSFGENSIYDQVSNPPGTSTENTSFKKKCFLSENSFRQMSEIRKKETRLQDINNYYNNNNNNNYYYYYY
jgi:hypothetical protein